jgi:hypothetical protein
MSSSMATIHMMPLLRRGSFRCFRTTSSTFGGRCSDVLFGYRVLSRRFVKSFPALTEGFDIEAQLTIHAIELNMPTMEADAAYKAGPKGSISKLHTYRDGVGIC